MSSAAKHSVHIASALGVYSDIEVSFGQVLRRVHYSILTRRGDFYFPQHFNRLELHAYVPGAGPVFAPRLLVAFGEQRARYASAAELQQYARLAPLTERRRQQ